MPEEISTHDLKQRNQKYNPAFPKIRSLKSDEVARVAIILDFND